MQEVFPYFRAMADRKRLWIVQYLAGHDEVSVTELSSELHLSQPLVSWHLRLLRRANIVATRREGRVVFCSLNRQALRTYEQRIDNILGLDESEEQKDSAPMSLQGA